MSRTRLALAASRRQGRAWLIAGAALALLSFAASAFAQARTEYLIRVLRTSSMMRVRTQAAISLGGVPTTPDVVQALVGALRDDEAPVRAAAAAALERHGDPSALPALRERARRDREEVVRNAASRAVAQIERLARTRPRTRPVAPSRGGAQPSGAGRFYVAVGQPRTRTSVSRPMLDTLRTYLERQVAGVAGVVVAPQNERPAAANRVLGQRGLVGYLLDSSIVELTDRPEGGVRARVAIIVQSYPGRDIRGELTGTATVTAGRGDAVRRQAIEAAMRGALRNLPQIMEAGVASARVAPPRRRR